MTVTVYVPSGVELPTFRRILVDPDLTIDGESKATLAPAGSPLALSATVPVKPVVDDTVMFKSAWSPWRRLVDVGDTETENVGGETISVTDA